MAPTAKDLVLRLLANATHFTVVQELVADDATYVSLNQDNPDLVKIEPWCGTHTNAGPSAIHKTFVDVNRYWKVDEFNIETVIAEGGDVAVFGRFRYTSNTLGKGTASPFAVLAKVDLEASKIVYMQFMEDTFSTAASFKKSGKSVYASNPDGGEVTIE